VFLFLFSILFSIKSLLWCDYCTVTVPPLSQVPIDIDERQDLAVLHLLFPVPPFPKEQEPDVSPFSPVFSQAGRFVPIWSECSVNNLGAILTDHQIVPCFGGNRESESLQMAKQGRRDNVQYSNQ